jgi:4-hydroxyphenylpyruvate dioxygenase
VTLYRQGDVNFILNAEPNSQAECFSRIHGPSANAIAFRVQDAAQALNALIASGAKSVESGAGPMELRIPAIEGIGGSLIYLVDRYGDHTIYDVDFRPIPGVDPHPTGVGLTYVDHLTHNVETGNMARWSSFYEKHFNFKEVHYFDIEAS